MVSRVSTEFLSADMLLTNRMTLGVVMLDITAERIDLYLCEMCSR